MVEIFSGKMNTMRLVDEVEASEVEVTIESKLVELARASNYRYTNDSHLARQPGDTFLFICPKHPRCERSLGPQDRLNAYMQ